MIRPKFQLVFFDVDSTLVTIEGIDELARGNEEIASLTEAAMSGEVPVEQVYERRLDLIRPSRSAIENLAHTYLRSLTPGAEETIGDLRKSGVDVHLATAGIHQAIEPLASRLQIPARALHAVRLSFDHTGNYADFDRRSPLTRSRGKEIVVRDVRSRNKGKIAFIGDGVTDLEAATAADLFIGFGGVTIRERVQKNAPIYVTDPDLRAILPHLFEEAV
ncbi:MAG TPA: HAD-IB family phosphatase [Thermoanaerobaculia bacterium]|nr:HAD-IB family phosphatase [Thermoanaerobaculia bacterium]